MPDVKKVKKYIQMRMRHFRVQGGESGADWGCPPGHLYGMRISYLWAEYKYHAQAGKPGCTGNPVFPVTIRKDLGYGYCIII
jgi:hypothetical protein